MNKDDATAKDLLNMHSRTFFDAIQANLYNNDYSAESKASAFLENLGIKGNTHTEFEARHFIVFNPDNIEIKQRSRVQFMHTPKGEVYGAKLPDGTIYINPEKLNANTPIHEFSHLWEQVMPNAWNKGLELFKQTKTGKDLVAQLQKDGNYKNLSEEQLWSEAMNTLIGNIGEEQYHNPKSKMAEFIQWVKDTFEKFYNYVTGKSELNKEYDLKDFTGKVLGDLLGDKLLTPESVKGNDTANQYAKDSNDIRFQILGEKGAEALDKYDNATRRMDNLGVAREMETAKKTAKEIRLATGWERGKDGKWRYEVLDGEITQTGKKYNTLSELLPSKSEILKSYPEISKLDVVIDINDKNEDTGQYTSFADRSSEGLFDVQPKIIISAKSQESVKSILLHEIQHAIQDIEGFAKGGSPENFRENENRLNIEIEELKTFIRDEENGTKDWLKVEDELNNLTGNEPDFDDIADRLIKEQQRIEDETGLSRYKKELSKLYERLKNSDGFVTYKRLAGEVESRNIESRMNMTAEQRRQTLLEETEDVDRKDQTVIMEGFEQAESISEDTKKRPNSKQYHEETRQENPAQEKKLFDKLIEKLEQWDKDLTMFGLNQKAPIKKKGALNKFRHRPTLPRVTAVPSALAGLTSLFGMGRGGHRRYRHLNIFLLFGWFVGLLFR